MLGSTFSYLYTKYIKLNYLVFGYMEQAGQLVSYVYAKHIKLNCLVFGNKEQARQHILLKNSIMPTQK